MRFESMKQALIRAAEAEGLSEYEIYYCMEETTSAKALGDEIHAFGSSASGGICFRCIVTGKMGYASGELLTEDAMEEMVKNAVSNAACIDSEDEVSLFAGSPVYQKTTAPNAELADAKAVRDAALDLQR